MCKNMIRVGFNFMVALVASTLPLASNAQSVDDWKWQASVYGWFPSLSGKTSFPPSGGGPSLDIDADSILDNLDFVFMGSIEGQKGRWGLWTDLVYIDLSASKSATRDFTIGRQAIPVGVDLNANYEIKAWAWTVAATYSVIATPDHSMQTLAGARLLDVEQKLGWQFNGNVGALPLAASGSSAVSESMWDGIIGVKGRVSFGANREWFVPYYVDIGTGQSDFTWQGLIGIGYQFNKWGAVSAGWRYLDYEFESGKNLESLTLSGPIVGVTFRW
jgi:hypothetical protein